MKSLFYKESGMHLNIPQVSESFTTDISKYSNDETTK